MDGRALGDAVAKRLFALFVFFVMLGVGLGWVMFDALPELWHHLSIGWKR